MEALTPGLIAELACAARDWDGFERDATSLVMEAIGGETVFFSDPSGISRHALGVITEVRAQTQPLWPAMAIKSAAVLNARADTVGTLIDSEVFGRELERMPYYDLLMRPVHGRSTLLGLIGRERRFSHKIAIGRCRGSSPFKERHRRLLGALLPTITLASAALLPRSLTNGVAIERTSAVPSALHGLTPREREVLSYLRLGYSNGQIGSALGTRARTVRNQLSRVYEKLGVANRAEAVGLSLDLEALHTRDD